MKRHILKDDAYSDSGRRTRVATLGSDTLERLDQVTRSEIASLDKRIAELEILLRPQRPATDPVEEKLAQQEIRKLLRQKSELEIIVLFQELAVTGKDDLTMRAIEDAPQAFRLISDPAIIAAGRRARAERHDPNSAKLLSQLKSWRSILSAAYETAKAELDLPSSFLENISAS
jgi:hypothetical protein